MWHTLKNLDQEIGYEGTSVCKSTHWHWLCAQIWWPRATGTARTSVTRAVIRNTCVILNIGNQTELLIWNNGNEVIHLFTFGSAISRLAIPFPVIPKYRSS